MGCDDDGAIVVPIEVAREVAVHARAILLADMRARRKHYEKLGPPLDLTVDIDAVEAYYSGTWTSRAGGRTAGVRLTGRAV